VGLKESNVQRDEKKSNSCLGRRAQACVVGDPGQSYTCDSEGGEICGGHQYHEAQSR